MLEAFLYGACATAGVLVVYTAYDKIYDLCAWAHRRREAAKHAASQKRRRHQSRVPSLTNGSFVRRKNFTYTAKNCYNIFVKNKN